MQKRLLILLLHLTCVINIDGFIISSYHLEVLCNVIFGRYVQVTEYLISINVLVSAGPHLSASLCTEFSKI